MAEDDPDLTRPFEPCVIYYPDAHFTEMVLADTPVVYRHVYRAFLDLGYDMQTGKLVCIRISGNHEKR